MTRETCRLPNCQNKPGSQDRDDYRQSRFCSIQCETKWEHVKADARDAAREPEPELEPGREP